MTQKQKRTNVDAKERCFTTGFPQSLEISENYVMWYPQGHESKHKLQICMTLRLRVNQKEAINAFVTISRYFT